MVACAGLPCCRPHLPHAPILRSRQVTRLREGAAHVSAHLLEQVGCYGRERRHAVLLTATGDQAALAAAAADITDLGAVRPHRLPLPHLLMWG